MLTFLTLLYALPLAFAIAMTLQLALLPLPA